MVIAKNMSSYSLSPYQFDVLEYHQIKLTLAQSTPSTRALVLSLARTVVRKNPSTYTWYISICPSCNEKDATFIQKIFWYSLLRIGFLEDTKRVSSYTRYTTFLQYILPGNLEQSIQSRYFYLAVAPMLVVVAQELYFKITMKFIY